MSVFLCFICLLFPLYAKASAYDPLSDLPIDSGVAESFVKSVSNDFDVLSSDFQGVLEKVKEIDPKLAAEIESIGGDENYALSVLRSKLAQKTFDYYETKIMETIKEKSKQTGRKIREDGVHIWLDRGDLDKDKCRKDNYIVCAYPEDFEEFFIERYSHSEQGDIYNSLIFDIDMPEKNLHLNCELVVWEQKNQGFSSMVFDPSCQSTNYDVYSAWRTEQAQDILKGMPDNFSSADLYKEYRSLVLPPAVVTQETMVINVETIQ